MGPPSAPPKIASSAATLLFVRSLVEVGCQGPTAVCHGAWYVASDHDIESVERYPVVVAAVDMECECQVADTLRRPCRQRWGGEMRQGQTTSQLQFSK